MDTKIMDTKLKYKVDEISSSSTSSSNRTNELNISIVYVNKADNTDIIKLGYLSKKWNSSEDYGVKVGCTPEEEYFLDIKVEYEVTESVPG